MTLRNVLTMLATAAATAAVTLALLAPRGGNAQAGAVKPVIARPQLTSQGCAFALTTDKAAYEAGESPVLEVTAANPTDKPVTASVWVTVTSTSPAARMSRMLTLPSALWSHEYAFTLEPGEKKTIPATCEAKLPEGAAVSITLGDQNSAVLAGLVGIPTQGGPNYQQNSLPPNGSRR
jgi:hypothetical protein